MKWIKTSNTQQYAAKNDMWYTISKRGGIYLLTITPKGSERVLANTKGFKRISDAKSYAESN